MKRIITFAVATIALVGGAIGVQAFATTSHDEDKQSPAVTQTDPKADDGQREGFTEDHAGKPGETK
jgi:hypothetical protein